MAGIHDRFPDGETVLSLAPEELAGWLLYALPQLEQNGKVYRDAVTNALFNAPGPEAPAIDAKFPRHRRGEFTLAFSEAMNWLISQTLLVPDEGMNGSNGWLRLSRRGQKLAASKDAFKEYRQAAEFPKSMLHPSIADNVWLDLARADLDDAVFAAFKAVEIAVRAAGKYSAADIGVPLMRKAFDPTNGKLSDMTQLPAERQALSDLFAGAIGSYKNPHSHRTVTIQDPRDAQEMVVLASHLLRIVDARKKP